MSTRKEASDQYKGVHCDKCAGFMNVGKTHYGRGYVVRYRYCKECRTSKKTIEMQFAKTSMTIADINRAIDLLIMDYGHSI